MTQTDRPESKRPYHSPRRDEQARETRRKILAAARQLFASDGYAATTLPAIAREAGVSPPTIYVAFGTKLALLDALIKELVRGDDAPAPLMSRLYWREMLEEPDPVRRLALYASISRRIRERTYELAEIVGSAASADTEIAALRRGLGESRLADHRALAESLAAGGALARGLSVERAADVLWALDSVETYRALVTERGWSPEDYERWLASILVCALLEH